MVFAAGDILTADDLNPLFAYKTADESVTSSTTLQDDNHLFLSVTASTRYLVESYFAWTSPAAADFKFTYTTPVGVSGFWTALNPTLASAASAPYTGSLAWGSTGTFEGFATDMFARVNGILVVGGTAGTLKFQFAQNTSNATPCTVRAYSWLRLIEVS